MKTARERLIIFTRYPEAGKVKTRLIPALGEQGAAMLHRQMTEHTLNQVRKLQSFYPLSVEVCFTGGNPAFMEHWLGSGFIYQPQGEGNLGVRLLQAHKHAIQCGIDWVVFIGTDCPSLSAEFIAQAFHLLHSYQIVLGPAVDGGYYLIGLRSLLPEIFSGISWGSAVVLQQTINVAHKLNLSIAYLPELADIDRPEDLPIWEGLTDNT